MIDWWLLPISGAASHEIAPSAYWHARLMVLGWCVLLPLGALAARFYKVLPGRGWPRVVDDKRWWHAHRGLQWAGVLAMTAGLGVVLNSGGAASGSPMAQAHAWAGWSVCVVGWLQVAGSLVRGSKGGPTDLQMRGDHYDMTARRVAFERLHKSLGWAAVVVAIGVIALGLGVADAPRWMALVLALWWLMLAAAFVRLQRQGRCIDTYQAIWGTDPAHPGNRKRPVGWGVRRPLG
jgi:hypothetical protein